MKNRKAAMEMSMGTIVTIVLLMTVLVLGLVMVRSIFRSGTSSIDQIDQATQNEINKLFAEEGKKIVIYPTSREIAIKKKDSGGFGFSVKNLEQTEKSFSYSVSAYEIASTCQMSLSNANNLIILGESGTGINLASGSAMDNALLVKFEIPETAPLCSIRYKVEVKAGTTTYATDYVDLEIK